MSGGSTDYVITPDGSFTAPLRLVYPYSRTVGPTYGRFFEALLEHRIEGTKNVGGHVFVPPVEFDPATGDALSQLAVVASVGTVTTWSWQPGPYEGSPLPYPFAWALIQLDGASTTMLHAVDCGAPEAMRTGMRVVARWAEEPTPGMSSLVCFDAVASGTPDATSGATTAEGALS